MGTGNPYLRPDIDPNWDRGDWGDYRYRGPGSGPGPSGPSWGPGYPGYGRDALDGRGPGSGPGPMGPGYGPGYPGYGR
jgi:hypothetical protein